MCARSTSALLYCIKHAELNIKGKLFSGLPFVFYQAVESRKNHYLCFDPIIQNQCGKSTVYTPFCRYLYSCLSPAGGGGSLIMP